MKKTYTFAEVCKLEAGTEFRSKSFTTGFVLLIGEYQTLNYKQYEKNKTFAREQPFNFYTGLLDKEYFIVNNHNQAFE